MEECYAYIDPRMNWEGAKWKFSNKKEDEIPAQWRLGGLFRRGMGLGEASILKPYNLAWRKFVSSMIYTMGQVSGSSPPSMAL